MNSGRRILASIGFLIAGIAMMLSHNILEGDEAISMAMSAASLTLGFLGLATAFGMRDSGNALIRLDHFMPFARRKRLRPGKPSLIVTLAHRLLPRHLFFDPETGKEGSVRRWLRKIGPSTLSSPWRRLIQAFTFTLFTVLFFYVCWPYSAKPIEITQSIGSLLFRQIDQASGELLFETSAPNNVDWAIQDIWHLELPSSDAIKLPPSLPVQVIPTQASNLRLIPTDPLNADQLDQILLSDGPLPIYDHPRPFWPSHHSDNLHRKERIPAEFFLIIDPLVSLSTAIASGNWVWSLAAAFIILILCLVFPGDSVVTFALSEHSSIYSID